MLMKRLIPALACVAGLIGSPAHGQSSIPPDSAADRSLRAQLRLDLQRLVVAQEAYFAEHSRYAASIDALHVETSPGAQVALTIAERDAWAAVLTHRGRPG